MKWRKIGQIFKAAEYDLFFAKSPQAVIFDDFVRIYFSTCIKDDEKVITDVRFADYTLDFAKIINVSKHIVIKRGELGCYDEHGIFPFSPFKDGDIFYAYLSGWTRRVSVSVDSGIGIAVSKDDGYTFSRLGKGPILTASLNEPYLVIDGFVKKFNDIFYMWYIFGTNWRKLKTSQEFERNYKIGYAISIDGINWVKQGRQIIDDKFEDECQALPSVIEHNGRHHMFFCYRNTFDFRTNKNNSYKIGYAYSHDLTRWIRDDGKILLENSGNDWDSDMQCYPNVFKVNQKIYMLYNGNDFGKYGFGLAYLEENEL